MKRIVCNLETIAKTFLSVAGSIFGLIAIITVRGKMILPSFGKEFFPSTVSRFFSSR